MIFSLSFIVLIVIIICSIIFLKKLCKIIIPVALILCIASPIGISCFQYYLQKKNFKSFDLAELKRQELIIQQIDFKKFYVYGTENKGKSTLDKITDELHVYHVSGHANIAFTDIENLELDAEKSDIANGICRIKYKNNQKATPFNISVVIGENDTYKVASFESDEVNFKFFKKDVITPDMSQSQAVEAIKKELQEEFYRQIIDKIKNQKDLVESDLYQTFITRLTEIITGLSDWKTVEIEFAKGE